ncbi:hypothetical protein [Micromonospora sp. NPDC047730]|uniref:hypothetical protein n=1 Tax=Micromonospora sp. NPDC047730 TaxID=3364253 RepID=UPI00371ECA6D
MDFVQRLETLEQRLAFTRAEVLAAQTESREQLRQRIETTQSEIERSAIESQQHADEVRAGGGSVWAQMKADAAAMRADVRATFEERTQNMDAQAATAEADWAETGAQDALDYAEWAAYNAELAMLDAIDARSYAQELGGGQELTRTTR